MSPPHPVDADSGTAPLHDRDLLRRLMAGPATGEALARQSGLTRAAVWKRIAALRSAGVDVRAQPGRGYVLAQPLDLLDADAIHDGLPIADRGKVAALDVAWSLGSTNTELLRQPTPHTGARVLLAERQTGGRGRRGRRWASPLAAHIYLSLARSFTGGLARLSGLSLVAGVATAEALRALGYGGVQLKWPNDLVVADGMGLRKLGGLLVEGGGEHAGPVRAVIGLGLNVRMPSAAAADISQPWVDLAALTPLVPPRNQLVAAVLSHWLPALDAFDAGGLTPFLDRYARLDALAGRDVMLHAPDGSAREARARGIADDGALLLHVDGRDERVHSGDVSVRIA